MYSSNQDWRVGGDRCFPDGDDDDNDNETNPREDHLLYALSIRIPSNQAIKWEIYAPVPTKRMAQVSAKCPKKETKITTIAARPESSHKRES